MAPTLPIVGPPLTPGADQLKSWGLDPAWSRRVTIDGSYGRPVDWHVLDTGPGPAGTVVCVHGNPSWGYVWRELLHGLTPGWRVIAVDQTGMGWSERGRPRRLADRVTELVSFCRQEVSGPLVLAAHDWGGPVAFAATLIARNRVKKLVLVDTVLVGDGRMAGSGQGGARWHHLFHRTPNLPEALTAGREAIYLGWFYDEYSERGGAVGPDDLAEYVRCYSQPGAMRCGFE